MFPWPLAVAIRVSAGELVQWELLDRGELIINERRRRTMKFLSLLCLYIMFAMSFVVIATDLKVVSLVLLVVLLLLWWVSSRMKNASLRTMIRSLTLAIMVSPCAPYWAGMEWSIPLLPVVVISEAVKRGKWLGCVYCLVSILAVSLVFWSVWSAVTWVRRRKRHAQHSLSPAL